MKGYQEYLWIILLFGLPLNIVGDKKKDDKKTCPGSNYAQLSDTCYYFYYDSKSWWEAQQFCEGNGGTFLIFQEKNEIKLIKKEIKKIAKNLDDTARFWLGLKHNEDDNEFYWADGTDLGRKNWENKLDNKVSTPGNCVVIQAKENSGANGKKWETKPCTERLPYVCEIDLSTSRWTTWGKWNDCSVTCGRGTKKRFRKCLQPTSASKPCEGSTSNTASCNDGTCPVTQWSKWSSWGGCSETCGRGIQTRSRTCPDSSCSGQSQNTRECNKSNCPVWDQWSKWESCSVTCGTGQKQRTRRCLNSKNSKDCKGNDKETEKCSLTDCPVWSKWSDWTGCSVTCGTGQKQRTRRCLNSKNSKDCKGNDKETEKCSLTDCPEWSKWSDWTGCSVTCGEGTSTRSRTCLNSKRNNDCKGNSKESKSCSEVKCLVTEWSKWSDWTGCSVTCGEGTSTRSRTCLNSKKNNDCKGKSQEKQSCVEPECPDTKKSKSKKKKMRNRVISARKTKNKGIVGYEILKTVTDRAVKCALYCLRHDTCRSFNYEFRKNSKKKTDKDNRICILNKVSLSDQPSALEAMPGFRLYDMGLFFDS